MATMQQSKSETEREGEKESERELHCAAVVFNLSVYKPELSHILHSLFSIFHTIYQFQLEDIFQLKRND